MLLQKIADTDLINSIIEPFNAIQSMRSSGVAHRKSKTYIKNLEKYGLSKLSNEDKMKKIVVDLISSLKSLNQQISICEASD